VSGQDPSHPRRIGPPKLNPAAGGVMAHFRFAVFDLRLRRNRFAAPPIGHRPSPIQSPVVAETGAAGRLTPARGRTAQGL